MVLIHQLATYQAVFRLHFNMQLFNDLNEDNMNKNIIKFIAASLMVTSFTSCMKEFDVEKNYVSQEELEDAPKAFSSLIDAITSNLSGEYTYSGADQYANDWGYPSILIQNDIMGQDIVPVDCSGNEWFSTWYSGSVGLGPNYALCQMPWTYYYLWIKNCNIVIAYPKGEPMMNKRLVQVKLML